jgi:hypothetical protein
MEHMRDDQKSQRSQRHLPTEMLHQKMGNPRNGKNSLFESRVLFSWLPCASPQHWAGCGVCTRTSPRRTAFYSPRLSRYSDKFPIAPARPDRIIAFCIFKVALANRRSLRGIFAAFVSGRNCLKPLQFEEDSVAQSVHDLYYNSGRPLETAETHRDFRTSKE